MSCLIWFPGGLARLWNVPLLATARRKGTRLDLLATARRNVPCPQWVNVSGLKTGGTIPLSGGSPRQRPNQKPYEDWRPSQQQPPFRSEPQAKEPSMPYASTDD